MITRLSRREFIKLSAQGAAIAGFTGLAGHGHRSLSMTSDISQTSDPSLRITSLIEDFTLTSPLNTLNIQPAEKAFDKPIVGFASGADPIFQQYKKIIGPYHWTPLEIFKLSNVRLVSCIA